MVGSAEGAAVTLAELRRVVEALPPGASLGLPREYLLEVLPAATAAGPGDTADFTLEAVAARFGRSRSTVRGWLEAGRLPGAYKLRGRSWRIPPAALDAFLEAERSALPSRAPAAGRLKRGQALSDWRKARAVGAR